MKTRNLYIHIGFGKTGTSAIQRFLANSPGILANAGFFYPQTGRVGSNHQGLANAKLYGSAEELERVYEELLREIESQKHDSIILSSEYFCFSPAELVALAKRIFSGFRINVVFYVREQTSLIESAYLQWLKVGKPDLGSIEDFFARDKAAFDFQSRIEPWTEHMGRQSIIVRVYDRAAMQDGVIPDFTRLLGIDISSSHVGGETNPSLLPELAGVASEINALELKPATHGSIMSGLVRVSQAFKRSSAHSLVSPALKREILSYYRESNRIFGRHFLPEDQRDLL